MSHLLATMCFFICLQAYAQDIDKNPLLAPFKTPFGVPPFDQIKEEHFLPAIRQAIQLQQSRVEAIISNTSTPTFENVIEALEYSGEELDRINMIFGNLSSAHTNPTIQAIAKESAPLQAGHRDNILLNQKLFDKVQSVYRNRSERQQLTLEQNRLLEETYKRFLRNGAALSAEDKETLRQINQRLSTLSLQFGDNVLAETNQYRLVVDRHEDLSGLPQSLVDAAANSAREAGITGKWVFTLHNPSIMPFLQYADNRVLREEILKAYLNRGNQPNEYNNTKIIEELVKLRIQRAQLLGYNTHADYVLEENMAQNPKLVYQLLDQLWKATLPMLESESAELIAMANIPGFRLESWDWRYYTEKLRKQKFDFDDAALRPYFELNASRDAMFDIIYQLWGLTFKKLENMPVYHPDVEVFEVLDQDGSHLGILYADYYPRSSKRGGAWMSSYRKQSKFKGENIRPVITIVCNFTKPVGNEPSLLSIDELQTLYHEMGHALHGLLSNVTYKSLSGTAVSRDFVELPSQIMENWATHEDILKKYARHYKTGEPMPQELIDKMKAAEHFNMGFITGEYLAASYLDMAYHTLTDPNAQVDIHTIEEQVAQKLQLPYYIPYRYRSTYFNHIFSGGYSAGYYSYIWSEVLDADAFDSFVENGLFDQSTALSFRKNILEMGGTEQPMILYKRFKGREPRTEPLLERRGLISVESKN